MTNELFPEAIPTVEAVNEEIAAEVAAAPPRRRGRPPRQQSPEVVTPVTETPRRRGRTRRVAEEIPEDTNSSSETETINFFQPRSPSNGNNGNPTVWASLGMTVNMGNYENQKIDIGVSGIPAGASEELINAHMEQAVTTLHTVVDKLAQEMSRRMADYGR